MKYYKFLSLLLILSCSVELQKNSEFSSSAITQGDQTPGNISSDFIATSTKGMVTSAGKKTSEIGKMILALGGNAVDAAIAMSFAISVERPMSTGIGGGGFALVSMKGAKKLFYDFRERAPLRSTRTMFESKPEYNNSENGPLAIAVPGVVDGLVNLHKSHGTLPWEVLVQPAIELAERGVEVSKELAQDLIVEYPRIIRDGNMVEVFFDDEGDPLKAGDILVQKNLAHTLKEIQKNKSKAFYEGEFPKKVIEHLKADGILQESDFKLYSTRVRPPLQIKFKDYVVYSAPSPSSGGTVLAEILNMLELKSEFKNDLERTHYYTEMMKLAYFDRAKWLGDDQFTSVPTEKLISKKYALIQFQKIKPDSVMTLDPPNHLDFEHPSTTHFNVVDSKGNVVSSTQTINTSLGSKVMVEGVILNNEMDDFTTSPGKPNAYGLISSFQNAIQAGKTPLSSMTPTIVEKNGQFVLSVGAKGGSQIISTVFLIISRLLMEGYSPTQALLTKRFHHQTFPNILVLDVDGYNPELVKYMEKLGHKVEPSGIDTIMTFIYKDKVFHGGVDPVSEGLAVGLE